MEFVDFVDGIKMDDFVKIAIEETKLKAPYMEYSYEGNGKQLHFGSSHDAYIPELAQQQGRVRVAKWEFKFSAA